METNGWIYVSRLGDWCLVHANPIPWFERMERNQQK